MHELLSISDLVITKPGGLTVSEMPCQAPADAFVRADSRPGRAEGGFCFASSDCAPRQHTSRSAPPCGADSEQFLSSNFDFRPTSPPALIRTPPSASLKHRLKHSSPRHDPLMSRWFLLFVPLVAFMWAMMEIEIEGPHGWAAKLPTWRIEKHILLDIFMGGAPDRLPRPLGASPLSLQRFISHYFGPAPGAGVGNAAWKVPSSCSGCD